MAPLELLAGYLATNQAGETQDRFIEPSADRRACRLLWGRSGQFGLSPFVLCRHVSMSLAKSDFDTETEAEAGDEGKGDPTCVRNLDGHGVGIGRVMQTSRQDDRNNRNYGLRG